MAAATSVFSFSFNQSTRDRMGSFTITGKGEADWMRGLDKGESWFLTDWELTDLVIEGIRHDPDQWQKVLEMLDLSEEQFKANIEDAAYREGLATSD